MASGELLLGYRIGSYDNYTLKFHRTGGTSWPTWNSLVQNANSRFYAGGSGAVPNDLPALPDPEIRCELADGEFVLTVLPLPDTAGQLEVSIIRNDREVDSVSWNGHAPLQRQEPDLDSHRIALYQVQVTQVPLDGELFWD